MSEYSQFPWRYENEQVLSARYVYESPVPVCSVSCSWKNSTEMAANGELIAAAPNLLTACKLALPHLADEEAADAVARAIAAAEGRKTKGG